VDDDLDDALHDNFDLYDLDNTGAIKSYSEMRNLTVNLCITLNARIPGGAVGVEEMLQFFKGNILEKHPLSAPFYAVWFAKNVLDPFYVFQGADFASDEEDSEEDEDDFCFARHDVKKLYRWADPADI